MNDLLSTKIIPQSLYCMRFSLLVVTAAVMDAFFKKRLPPAILFVRKRIGISGATGRIRNGPEPKRETDGPTIGNLSASRLD